MLEGRKREAQGELRARRGKHVKKALMIIGVLAVMGGIAYLAYRIQGPERARLAAAGNLPANVVFTSAGGRPVNVTITSDPPDATVTFSHRSVGRTPVTVQVDAERSYSYSVVADEPYEDYRLYKAFNGNLTATDTTTVSVWIDRTTAEEQAAARKAAEDTRRAAQEARRAQEQARKEEAERAAAEQQRRLEAERLYYRLETNCRYGADLTYANAYGDTTQQSNQGNGWYYYFVPKKGQYLYLSAQNQCDSGYVRVKFVMDGKTLRENTSSGGYVIATISGRW